jgi:FtsH-binding integral membrane protein
MNQLATHSITSTGDERVYFRRVFAWMSVALAVTGGVAAAVGHTQTAMHVLLGGSGTLVLIALLLIELALVSALVGLVQHMDLFQAAATFIGYAALNGVTLSIVFAVFTTKSIFATFLVTAGMFGVLALIGATTNIDLTKWGSFLFMALIGQMIGLVVNLVWFNSTLYWVTTATGILLFSALTAYDIQKLKRYEPEDGADAETVEKSAIVGALALYLDFVNLFLYLLRLFGRRR